MSPGIRGRAMIININTFSQTGHVRTGSEIDYSNLARLFKDLKFELVKTKKELTDLTAQVGAKDSYSTATSNSEIWWYQQLSRRSAMKYDFKLYTCCQYFLESLNKFNFVSESAFSVTLHIACFMLKMQTDVIQY